MWNKIGNVSGCDDAITAAFIKELFRATDSFVYPDGSTGSDIYQARTALTNWGYSSQMSDYSYGNMIASLDNNRPVYVDAMKDGSISDGHAWVCDGYDSKTSTQDFVAKALEDCPDYMTPSRYETIYNRSIVGSSEDLSHMNWGWGTGHNGWFFGTENIEGNKYSKNKRILFNIYPLR